MPIGPRRPLFYLGVMVAGFVLGGFLNALVKAIMPESVARQVFTFSVSPSFGPVSVDLLVLSFTLGPVAVHVTLLAVVGVVVAYLVARSLF